MVEYLPKRWAKNIFTQNSCARFQTSHRRLPQTRERSFAIYSLIGTNVRFVGSQDTRSRSLVALSFLSYPRPFICPRLLRANGKRGYENQRDDPPRAILQPYPSILRFDGEWDSGYNRKPPFRRDYPEDFQEPGCIIHVFRPRWNRRFHRFDNGYVPSFIYKADYWERLFPPRSRRFVARFSREPLVKFLFCAALWNLVRIHRQIIVYLSRRSRDNLSGDLRKELFCRLQ